MADPEDIYERLLDAVMDGRQKTVRELINSYGLSHSQEWLGGYVLLCHALMNNHKEIAKLLLTNGSKVNSENVEPSDTPLHVAAINSDIEIFKTLLDKGAKVDTIGRYGRTPLHCAIECNTMEYIELLLNHGADVNVTGGDNMTPLHVAAGRGDESIVEHLLNCGACIDSSTLKKGHTPLHFALRAGHHTVVQLLLQHGADVDIQDKDGTSILHHAVQTRNIIIVKEVLKYRPDINNPINRRSLITAVLGYGGDCNKIVEALFEYGFVINPEDANNTELLHAAIGKKYFTIVQELLKYGADVNARDESDKTPLVRAVEYNDLEMTKLLCFFFTTLLPKTNGAHVNPAVLNTAVIQEHIDIVEALLEHGVDINAGDEDGLTALHHAILNYHKEIVKILLERGADVESRDEDGSTPLHLAANSGNKKAVETLLQLGADINSRENSGRTALHLASGYGRTKVVITLLKYGADINITDFDNLTPIGVAMEDYNYEEVDVLIRHIVKMKAANLYVSEENLQAVSNIDDEVSDFQNECEVEIANMKSKKIDMTNISFHDILTKHTNSLAMYMRNENIVSALKSDEYKATFPIYADMIERNIRQGMEQQELLQQCNKVLHNLFPVLPDVCIDIVLSCLSNEDLRMLPQ